MFYYIVVTLRGREVKTLYSMQLVLDPLQVQRMYDMGHIDQTFFSSLLMMLQCPRMCLNAPTL
jgi:hypothetical protein